MISQQQAPRRVSHTVYRYSLIPSDIREFFRHTITGLRAIVKHNPLIGLSINSHMNKKTKTIGDYPIKVSMATEDYIAVGIGIAGVILFALIITGNI